jgi:hypothetical protein
MSTAKDFESAYLSDGSFPSGEFPEAISEIQKNERTIKKAAFNLFADYVTLFNQIGMGREDLMAIFRAYTYSYFANKKQDETLEQFLYKKSVRLWMLCVLKSEGMVEEQATADLNELSHNDNPEEILIAKESSPHLYKHFATISGKLH